MLMRMKIWKHADGGIFERMKNYEFLEEDRLLFTHKWPRGMKIPRRGRIRPLELWIRHINNDAEAAPAGGRDQCLITEQTIEKWIRTIGKLPEQTMPVLAEM